MCADCGCEALHIIVGVEKGTGMPSQLYGEVTQPPRYLAPRLVGTA